MNDITYVYTTPRNGGYNLFFKNGHLLGELLLKEDGFYDWWPTYNGGCFASYVLHAIADKLDELNQPRQKELDEYFEVIEEHRVPV